MNHWRYAGKLSLNLTSLQLAAQYEVVNRMFQYAPGDLSRHLDKLSQFGEDCVKQVFPN